MTAPDTPAPPPSQDTGSYIPVITDLVRLARAPFAPRSVFEEQQEHPTVWMPWLVLSVVWAVVAFFMMPLTIRAAQLAAQAQGRPLPAAAHTFVRISSLVGPGIGLLIGLLIGALVLYVVLMVLGSSARFKGLMCVTMFASTIAFVQSVVTTVALRMRGVGSIQSPADLQMSFGLDLAFPVDWVHAHRALGAFLRGIGPFEIWAVVITAIGLAALEKVPSKKAWTTAWVAFVIGLFIRAGLALVFKQG